MSKGPYDGWSFGSGYQRISLPVLNPVYAQNDSPHAPSSRTSHISVPSRRTSSSYQRGQYIRNIRNQPPNDTYDFLHWLHAWLVYFALTTLLCAFAAGSVVFIVVVGVQAAFDRLLHVRLAKSKPGGQLRSTVGTGDHVPTPHYYRTGFFRNLTLTPDLRSQSDAAYQ